jgi:hypothetical protein
MPEAAFYLSALTWLEGIDREAVSQNKTGREVRLHLPTLGQSLYS